MTVNREKNGRFAVGNPGGGRPKLPNDVKEATRAACPEAVEILIGIMRNPKEKTSYRLDAIKTILDRAYGKPVQMQDISMDMAGSVDLTGQIRRVAMELVNDKTVGVSND